MFLSVEKRVPFLNIAIITGLRQKSRGLQRDGKDWKKLEIPGKNYAEN
jgi:hypothetical protein